MQQPKQQPKRSILALTGTATVLALLTACASPPPRDRVSYNDRPGTVVPAGVEYGQVRNFDFESVEGLRVGDRVKLEGKQLYRV